MFRLCLTRRRWWGLALVVISISSLGGQASAARGKPTPEQIAWHEMEIEMFLALDPCTWQGREYDIIRRH